MSVIGGFKLSLTKRTVLVDLVSLGIPKTSLNQFQLMYAFSESIRSSSGLLLRM